MTKKKNVLEATLWMLAIYLELIQISEWILGFHFQNRIVTEPVAAWISLVILAGAFYLRCSVLMGLGLALLLYTTQWVLLLPGLAICAAYVIWSSLQKRAGSLWAFLFALFGKLSLDGILILNVSIELDAYAGEDGAFSLRWLLMQPYAEIILLLLSVIYVVLHRKKRSEQALPKEKMAMPDCVRVLSFVFFLVQAARLGILDGRLPWEPLHWQLTGRDAMVLYQLLLLGSAVLGSWQIPIGVRFLDCFHMPLSRMQKALCAFLAAAVPSALFLDATVSFGGWLQMLFMLLILCAAIGITERKRPVLFGAGVLLVLLAGYLWYCEQLAVLPAFLIGGYVLYLLGRLMSCIGKIDVISKFHMDYAVAVVILLFFWLLSDKWINQEIGPYTGYRELYQATEDWEGDTAMIYPYTEKGLFAMESRQNAVDFLTPEQADYADADFLITTSAEQTQKLQRRLQGEMQSTDEDELYFLQRRGAFLVFARGEDTAMRNDCELRRVKPLELADIEVQLEHFVMRRGHLVTLELKLLDEQAGAGLNVDGYALAYHLYDADGESIAFESVRTEIPAVISSEDTIYLAIDLDQFKGEEAGYIVVDAVWELHEWMSWEHPDHTLVLQYEDGMISVVEDMGT